MYMKHMLLLRGPNKGSTPRCLRHQTQLQQRPVLKEISPCESTLNTILSKTYCAIRSSAATFYGRHKEHMSYVRILSPDILALGRVGYNDKHLFKSFNAVIMNFRIKMQQLISGNNSHQIPKALHIHGAIAMTW